MMEEIVFAKKWVSKKYEKKIKFPMDPFGNTKSTASFAFAAITLHLAIIHIILGTLGYHKYVPGIVTSVILLVPSCYILKISADLLQYSLATLVIWSVVGIAISLANLRIVHKYMNQFNLA